MSRYRRVEVGTWNDDRFRELSAPPPSARYLWLYLLCGARTTVFPGLVVATEEVIASDLRWPLDADLFGTGEPPRSLREAWKEIADRGMVRADWRAGVVVLPKALRDRRGAAREAAKPTSPNAFRGWAKAWGDIPECSLAAWYLGELGRFAEALDRVQAKSGDAYRNAFRDAFATPLERVRDAYPDASSAASTESLSDVNASPTRPPTRLEPTRVPETETVPERLQVDPSGLGSGSGSPLLSRPGGERVHGAEPSDAALRRMLWPIEQRLATARAALAHELGLDVPKHEHPTPDDHRDAMQRLRESWPKSLEYFEHVLEVAIAEARASTPPTIRFLGWCLFRAKAWNAKVRSQPSDAAARGERGERNVFDEVDRAVDLIEKRGGQP